MLTEQSLTNHKTPSGRTPKTYPKISKESKNEYTNHRYSLY